MGTWIVASDIETKTKEELIELRDSALRYLVNNQLDGVGCAESLGISFYDFLSLKELFREDFDLSKKALISDCEAYIAGVAQGTVVDKNASRMRAAVYILDRQSPDWIPKKSVKETKEELPPSNGKGAELISKFVQETKEDEWIS